MAFTTNFANKVLDDNFHDKDVYVALYTDDAEVNASGYARKKIPFNSASDGKTENDEEIKFDIAEEDWGEIVSAAIFDDESGGNKMDEADIDDKRDVRENDQFSIPEGNYTIEVK